MLRVNSHAYVHTDAKNRVYSKYVKIYKKYKRHVKVSKLRLWSDVVC